VAAEDRPSFYALAPGGWRDYVTLLHLPYTAWNLGYVAIGAALAPVVSTERLVLALAAFFLAVGIAAHALDELNGRPLQTRISDRTLVALASVSLLGAVAVGIYAAIAYTPWIALFAAVGAFAVVAYNAELFGGRFHGDVQFALTWGAFPLLTGAFVMEERFTAAAVVAAAFAFCLSLAQRRLSTQVRDVRRRVAGVSGTIERRDGTIEPVTTESLIGAEERALKLMAAAVVLLAVALLALHR
jgi:hypothetical protein